MEPSTRQARAVVAELQQRATARRRRWQPGPLPAPPVRTPMTVHQSLDYLHNHWVLPDSFTAAPAGPRWRQLVWKAAGRFTFGVLSRYLAEERELLSRVVQAADTLARRVDTLEAEIDQLAAACSRQFAELAGYLPDPPEAGLPGDQMPGDQTPDDQMPDNPVPGDQMPGDQMPDSPVPGGTGGVAAGDVPAP